MKTLFIFVLPAFLLAMACSSLEKTAGNEALRLTEAVYHHWSEASLTDTDTIERGTDLALTFSNWPDEYTPGVVVFRNKTSFPATIEENENNQVIIRARIVHESAVLSEISETTDLSDRLTFSMLNGETDYIEIENWERQPGQ